MTKGTIIRTAALFVALVNQVLVMFAIEPLPIDATQIEIFIDLIYELLSMVFLFVAAIVAWWKNNSITEEAQEADEYLAMKKDEKKKLLG